MLRPRLPRCVAPVWRCSRALHGAPVRTAPVPVPISKLLESPPADPEDVTVNGFVRSIRQLKSRAFASIGDGSSLEPLQALLTPEQAHSLSTGAAVRLRGAWRPSPNPKAQSHELHVVGVDVLGAADPATFPLQKKYHTAEFLRTIPHLRTRTPFNSLLLRLRSQSIAELTRFFASRDFVQSHPPIITSSDCEGAGEVFDVGTGPRQQAPASAEDNCSFFRSTKYLTVSSQLHLEALAQSVGRVWTLSPTFRAERSDTARHLSEFYMLEAEVSFADAMDEVMDLVEDMLRHLTTALYPTQIGRELLYGKRPSESGLQVDPELTKELEHRWQGMMRESWPRITYTEAIDILKSSNEAFEHKPQWGAGLQAEHERYIAATVGKGSPVFVTAYPKEIKPFYMLPSAETSSAVPPGETVDCFDLLVPEVCEIVGGSMREYRYPELIQSMRSHGLLKGETEDDLGPLKWYAELRQWGSVPHGGFGLGFDRLLLYLSGVGNIREIVTFPRWVERCDC